MAVMPEEASFEQEQDAAARMADPRNAEPRKRAVAAIASGAGLEEFNSPERLARRLDRLSKYFAGEQVPTSVEQMPQKPADEVIASALERAATKADPTVSPVSEIAAAAAESEPAPAAGAEAGAPEPGLEHRAGVVLEAIIGTRDYVGIRYLEAGVAASRAVCRVNIRDGQGRVRGYGTGSLVSPRLLLTNHHVLGSAEVARVSGAEFNYQDGLDGQPLQPQIFALDPGTFFFADQKLDFALVAVAAGDRGLARFGFNRLIEAEGKAVVGEFVTIIQHPKGEKKQVALRENRIVGLLERYIHYATDTEPGSSGSLVFNDQWEPVALHHASVPAPDHQELGGIMNEGIRVSRILRYVKEQRRPRAQQALVDQLFSPEQITLAAAPDAPGPITGAMPTPTPSETGPATRVGPSDASATVELNLPLEISITVRPQSSQPAVPNPTLLPPRLLRKRSRLIATTQTAAVTETTSSAATTRSRYRPSATSC